MTAKKLVTDDVVAHATAVVMGVPFVDLRNVRMDQETLLNLPREVAERSMVVPVGKINGQRSEEHTSELQSQANISYAVFCLALPI